VYDLAVQFALAAAAIAVAGVATASVIVFLHWLWAVVTGNIRL